MTRVIPRPADDLDGSATDTVRCPRACGDTLSFRSEPLTGCAQSRCFTCGTPWTNIPRRDPTAPIVPPPAIAPLPAPVKRAPVIATPRRTHLAPLRDRILAVLPATTREAMTAAEIGDRLRWHSRHSLVVRLRQLTKQGVLVSRQAGRRALHRYWRAA